MHTSFLKYSTLLLALILLLGACDKPLDPEETGNCTDGIYNQSETDIDCGGPCLPCSSCEDGLRNGTETGIDCGGNCRSCDVDCSVPAATVVYTIVNGYDDSQSTTTNYYSNFNLTLNFSNGNQTGLSSMDFKFYITNPTVILANGETKVYTTVNDFSSSNKGSSNVFVKYRGNYGFSSFNNALNPGQLIYLSRVSANE